MSELELDDQASRGTCQVDLRSRQSQSVMWEGQVLGEPRVTTWPIIHYLTVGEEQDLIEERESFVVGLMNSSDTDSVGISCETFDY